MTGSRSHSDFPGRASLEVRLCLEDLHCCDGPVFPAGRAMKGSYSRAGLLPQDQAPGEHRGFSVPPTWTPSSHGMARQCEVLVLSLEPRMLLGRRGG